jgi:hypothetical protein
MERRRHQRFYTSIPIKYLVRIPESPEVCWIGHGVLKNVSFGGVYFRSNDTPPLEQGHIRDFTITSTEELSDFSKITCIRAKGRVVRIEPPQTSDHDIGVALEFLSGPELGDFRN